METEKWTVGGHNVLSIQLRKRRRKDLGMRVETIDDFYFGKEKAVVSLVKITHLFLFFLSTRRIFA